MSRIDVLKTYKIFIGGKFPRTESGRYFHMKNAKGDLLANMCLSSRKDLRNAVVAARKAQEEWVNATALNNHSLKNKVRRQSDQIMIDACPLRLLPKAPPTMSL